jgi:hypothetical protein
MSKMISTRNFFLITFTIFIVVVFCLGVFKGIYKPEPLKGSESDIIEPIDSLDMPSRGFYMGILPLPCVGQSFEDAFKKASQDIEIVPIWGRPTPFYDLSTDLSGPWGENFLTSYTRGNNMIPLLHLSFIGENFTLVSPPGIKNATLSDPTWRQAYKEAALDVVECSKPLFLSLGNEVNRWYEVYGVNEDDPNGFQHYVSLYNELYDEVKRLSPRTQVFCVFAREIVSENKEADLGFLSLFNSSKLDILVFTSYPSALKGVKNASDLPDDYYSRALEYAPDKPLGFSELGWPAMEYFGGEAGQANFLKQVTGRLSLQRGVDLRLLCWAWLYDLSDSDTVGLITRDGRERVAYQTWQSLSHS